MQTIAAIAAVAMLFMWGKDKLAGVSLASFTSLLPAKKQTVATVVESWEALATVLESHGRLEALAKLNEMFPLLNKVSAPPVADKAGA